MAIITHFQEQLKRTIEQFASVEDKGEQWLTDHNEARACYEMEAEVNRALFFSKIAFAMDLEVHAAYANGADFEESFEHEMTVLLENILRTARTLDLKAQWFEKLGYKVQGISELRHAVQEIVAMLSPSDEVIPELEQQAILANQPGDLDDWPEEE